MSADVRIRLAFRAEGPWYVCYLAQAGTMDDAIEYARVAIGATHAPALRRQFVELCKAIYDQYCRELGVPAGDWGELEPGPEHERPGTA
jgi:hypothetical protein